MFQRWRGGWGAHVPDQSLRDHVISLSLSVLIYNNPSLANCSEIKWYNMSEMAIIAVALSHVRLLIYKFPLSCFHI